MVLDLPARPPLAFLVLMLAACESARTSDTCDNCHGGGGESAPPRAVSGESSTDVVGVGAHRAHLGPSDWHAAGVCEDCHVVPEAVDARGHIDGLPAELRWSARAGAEPQWDGARCTNYCHGQTLDGALIDPEWTVVDGTQAACGTCHGLPPAGDHPQGDGLDDCSLCHGAVVGPDGAFVDAARHIDGVVDAVALDDLDCAGACHGSDESAAPPRDMSGDVATSAVGVGAHQAHLTADGPFRPGECADCHSVPRTVDAVDHLGSLPAELTWGWVAEADGAPARWDGATCGTYCHGDAEPRWTAVGAGEAACGTCHGLPPGGDHPATEAACSTCHGTVIAEDGSFVRPDLHGDGFIDVTAIDELSCQGGCHGDAASAAPPADVHGNTATTGVGVGAHRAHLSPSDWHRSYGCLECHDVPASASQAGHVDTALPAEVAFNGVAGLRGVAAAWDGATCTTYCHGATLDGGTNPTPIWTVVDGSGSTCGSCHGLPPGGEHPDDPACEVCHAEVIAADQTFIRPELHLDGYVQVNEPPLTCASCHGDAESAAPPRSLSGAVATTEIGVGAHRSHLATGSPWRAAVQCEDCHVVPADILAPGHADTALPAELAWGDLARMDGASPTWSGATCTNYCHGQTLTGGSDPSPSWTTVDGSQAACGTCHGLPPAPPHTSDTACEACHDTAGPGGTIALPSQHIDGLLQVTGGLTCTSCHGSGTDPAPPADTAGATATTATGVGAHQAHLATADWHAAVVCEDCHAVPAEIDASGHIDSALPAELTWGALAGADGALATWDGATCANYCHGQTVSGGSLTAPDWTTVDGTQAACGTCHGLPPAFPHVARTDCETCHDTAGVGGTIALPDQHIDGVVQLIDGGAFGCTSCHGTGDDPAPPLDTRGNSDPSSPGVGAHPAHAAVPCTECHLVPTDVADAGHLDSALPAELTWGPLATTGGVVPTYDGVTCTNYCHGATLSGASSPDWTSPAGTEPACGSCHGLPPDAPHTGSLDCDVCHDTAGPGLTIAIPEQHVDGIVQLIGGQTCTSCHGTGTDPAPPADTSGATATTATGVGAHQAHLAASTWHAAVPCTSCHVVPSDLDSAGHADSALPAEVTFGGISGVAAEWDGATCTTYCHGAFAPVWTVMDDSQDACGTCHALPPAAPHPADDACGTCHADVIDDNGSFIAPWLHIDGEIQSTCVACHALPQGDRRQVTGPGGDFERASHHVDDGSGLETVEAEDCLVCHDASVHRSLLDPDVLLVDPDLGVGDVLYDGTGESLEVFCLGCHDGDGALAVGSFSDGLVPTPIAELWANASHAADTPVELGDQACLACHGGPDATRADVTTDQDVHGSTWSSLLSPLVAGVLADNEEEGTCLACHDGAVGADLVTEFAKASRHPVADGDQLDGRSVECADCHDPHAATAAAPLLGVAGVDIDGAPVVADEPYQVCLKCHGDSYNTADARATNKRLDFDPSASSFHPVAAEGRNESEAMGNQLLGGLTVDSRVECADCHNSEATADVDGLASASTAAPQGPHGSENAYLLRSTYWTDPNAPANYDPADYDLCYLCHDPVAFEQGGMTKTNFGTSTRNYHELHLVDEEDVGCTNCHYNTHGNVGAENTDYRIDGVVYETPPTTVKTRGVSFSPDVLKQGANAEPQWRLEVATRKRSCYLVCHGETHTFSYTPPSGTDDDALAIP